MQKKTIYIITVISALASGPFLFWANGESLYSIWDIAVNFYSLLLLFAWYRIDTDELNIKRSIWSNCAINCFTLIAFPWYLIKFRGWRKGLVGTFVLLLISIAWGVLSTIGFEIAYVTLSLI